MADCQAWQDFFADVLRYTRGLGSDAPVAPDGLIPEGCTLSPCAELYSVGQAIDSLRTQIESRDYLNSVLPAGCPPKVVRAVRQGSFGNLTAGWEVYAPAGGECLAFSQKSFWGQALDCDPGPPPPVDTGDTAPLEVTITGGPWDGVVIQSLAVVGPTAQGLQKAIDGTACICQQLVIANAKLDEFLNGAQILLNLLGNLRDIGLQSQLTKNDWQQNWISLVGAIGSLSQVLDTRLKIHAVAVGGAEMDFPSDITNGVLNPADLQPIIVQQG